MVTLRGERYFTEETKERDRGESKKQLKKWKTFRERSWHDYIMWWEEHERFCARGSNKLQEKGKNMIKEKKFCARWSNKYENCREEGRTRSKKRGWNITVKNPNHFRCSRRYDTKEERNLQNETSFRAPRRYGFLSVVLCWCLGDKW